MLAWMNAGRISSISQCFDTASRNSFSLTVLGPKSTSAGNVPFANTKM